MMPFSQLTSPAPADTANFISHSNPHDPLRGIFYPFENRLFLSFFGVILSTCWRNALWHKPYTYFSRSAPSARFWQVYTAGS